MTKMQDESSTNEFLNLTLASIYKKVFHIDVLQNADLQRTKASGQKHF